MSNNDPWALLRTRDDFTLDEAARIVAGVPHGRKYPAAQAGWSQDLRDEKGRLDATFRELIACAAELGIEIRKVPNTLQSRRKVVTAVGEMWEPIRVAASSGTHLEYGRVRRDALEKWCGSRGMRPAFFYSVPAVEADKKLGTRERDTLLGLIAVLAEASGLDLRAETKGHTEAKQVAAWAAARRLNISTETIAKKLVQGREVIHPVGPVRGSN